MKLVKLVVLVLNMKLNSAQSGEKTSYICCQFQRLMNCEMNGKKKSQLHKVSVEKKNNDSNKLYYYHEQNPPLPISKMLKLCFIHTSTISIQTQ